MEAFPKPKDQAKIVEIEHTFKDGRTKINQLTKEGRALYQDRKRVAWLKQKKICSICHRPLAWLDATVDHIEPRKMGAGSIDDRQENIAAAHAWCNAQRGSKRRGYYGLR